MRVTFVTFPNLYFRKCIFFWIFFLP